MLKVITVVMILRIFQCSHCSLHWVMPFEFLWSYKFVCQWGTRFASQHKSFWKRCWFICLWGPKRDESIEYTVHWIACLTIYISQYQPPWQLIIIRAKDGPSEWYSKIRASKNAEIMENWRKEDLKKAHFNSAQLALSISNILSNHLDVCLLQKAYAFAMTPATKLARVVGDNFKFEPGK